MSGARKRWRSSVQGLRRTAYCSRIWSVMAMPTAHKSDKRVRIVKTVVSFATFGFGVAVATWQLLRMS